ncbi:hypothetical protein JTB14_015342 [Gonioctena quinquepunctata]|nr:hypothetical protein JTB14_015342 [Gonioctena quinquepunctata]
MVQSADSVASSSSFHITPVEENVINQEEPNDFVDTGFLQDMATDKTSSDGSIDENVVDASVKSSFRSGKMSSSSSINNSFILADDSQILQEKLELANQALNKKLLDLQHLYSELRNENAGLRFQVERTNEQLVEVQKEKDQYMARAQRILQEKEALISLKQENKSNKEMENIFSTYNNELKKELEFHQTKTNELAQKNIQLKKEIQSLQMQHQVIQNGLQSTNQSLEQSLLSERKFRVIAEEECSQKNEELYKKNQEISQLQETFEKTNIEIQKLKEAANQKVHSNDIEDLESRIASLTQVLMLKQNALETVTTEKHALRLQLEKIENKHRKNAERIHRTKVEVVDIEEPDDTIPVPKFMRVSPFDAGVTRRVKHAYSTLDAVSIRTGSFLRRYPVARVFVFCYMVLLHIWVLIILFIYVPSNH